jgi:sensor histidine kinase YesM
MNPYIRPGDSKLMRRYLDWAAPYYEKFNPESRAEAVELDRWLYSRQSIGFLLGLLVAGVGLFLGLQSAGLRTSFAIIGTFVVFSLALFAVMITWWNGEILLEGKAGFARKSPMLTILYLLAIAYIGSLVGFVIGGTTGVKELLNFVYFKALTLEWFTITSPATLAIAFVLMGVVALTSVIKKQQLLARVKRLKAEALIQQSAKALSEAKLRILQAQIKPHFLFNTLAALQYWTDQNDPRASKLLKTLTDFLRLSTDSMDRQLIALEQELAQTREYLNIMQFRMDNKLTVEFDIAPETLIIKVPPALLLTIVENAIEHGIEPSITGGLVRIRTTIEQNGLNVKVINTGMPLSSQFKEAVGLTNSRERIKAVYGEAARLDLISQNDLAQTVALFVLPNL